MSFGSPEGGGKEPSVWRRGGGLGRRLSPHEADTPPDAQQVPDPQQPPARTAVTGGVDESGVSDWTAQNVGSIRKPRRYYIIFFFIAIVAGGIFWFQTRSRQEGIEVIPETGQEVPASCSELLQLIGQNKDKTCSDEEYSPAADVNNDGKIGQEDASLWESNKFDDNWCKENLGNTTNPCTID